MEFELKPLTMSELKTKKNEDNVLDFIDGVEDRQKRQDCHEIMEIMKEITGEDPKMWGSSIVGFGSYHYKYDSRGEGDWFLTGFSPRKQNLSLYIMSGFGQYDSLLSNLGKYKTGKSCLYVKKLGDINRDILKEMITSSVQMIAKKYPEG